MGKPFTLLILSCMVISCSTPIPISAVATTPTQRILPTNTISQNHTPTPAINPNNTDNIFYLFSLSSDEINELFSYDAFEKVRISYQNTDENKKIDSYLGIYQNHEIEYGANLYIYLTLMNDSCEGLSRQIMEERLIKPTSITEINIDKLKKSVDLPPDIWMGILSDNAQIFSGFSFYNICVTFDFETVGVDPANAMNFMALISKMQYKKLSEIRNYLLLEQNKSQ